jgi:hypothetical protein
MKTDVSLLSIERDTLKKNLEELSKILNSVSKSKKKYVDVSGKMISLIKEMLISSRGWMSDEDLDAQAIALLEEYKDLKYGIQRGRRNSKKIL